ncbi:MULTISPECIES: hypothetical protein [Isoptericola]|uniref:Uncharacterized protein n=1 Tax=Isoptericola sediminis TaxID=2733572 RepID=A0A849K2R9_9MICO|nr:MULTISPECIES: hypothetical protein [Isoptericola]MDO8144769.1 hypothetical protein [Isoptericola sp. 178]MDO8149547.1 hypothetical protein [Isoptericola sp. b515]MDO8152481.1 hypothetical protein [Isoptericola sp. b408]NNU26349.1 hypothetical protein [Isoptericola sediminis]
MSTPDRPADRPSDDGTPTGPFVVLGDPGAALCEGDACAAPGAAAPQEAQPTD